MHPRVPALAGFLILATLPAAVSAQEPDVPPSDWTITLSGKAWVSTGWSNWNFESAGVNPLTDLRWRGVDAVTGEVTADIIWKRLIWTLGIGGNTLNEGAFLQDDFGRSNFQNRFSTIQSPVDSGYLVYVNSDVGARVVDWRQPLFGGGPGPASTAGYIDVFLGYQFWREQYTAYGFQGSLFFPSGLVVNQAEPSNVKFVRNQYTRHSLRLGARSQVPIASGLSLKLLAVISPYTHTDYEDTHYLQIGVRQPSISTANGGFGVQGEAGLSYLVWSGLSVEAGFRYWKYDSGSGTAITTSAGGVSVKSSVNEMITERYGPYFGLNWQF